MVAMVDVHAWIVIVSAVFLFLSLRAQQNTKRKSEKRSDAPNNSNNSVSTTQHLTLNKTRHDKGDGFPLYFHLFH
jgi:hypothetical protein